jgi:hypothetical protein
MVSMSPFKSYTASLFGAQPKMGVQVKLTPPAQMAPQPTAPKFVTPSAQTPSGVSAADNAGSVGGLDPEFLRDPWASLKKSMAAMEEWEAKEKQFEQENGFRRKVNSMAIGLYETAKAGNLVIPSYSSTDAASEDLAKFVGAMRTHSFTINHGLTATEYYQRPENTRKIGEQKTNQGLAELADSMLAADMDLFVLNTLVTKAFNLSESIYTKDDAGRVTFKAQDFMLEGKAFARMSEDGVIARLGADGQPMGVDRRV